MSYRVSLNVSHPGLGCVDIPVEVTYREFINQDGGEEPWLQRTFTDHEVESVRIDLPAKTFVSEILREIKDPPGPAEMLFLALLNIIKDDEDKCQQFCYFLADEVATDYRIHSKIVDNYGSHEDE